MSDVQVTNPYEGKTLDAIQTDVKGLNDKLVGILADYKDPETGDVKWHELKGDAARDVFEINQSMTQAHKRLEELTKLKGTADAVERLSNYMNVPAEEILPRGRKAPQGHPSLGQAFVNSPQYKGANPSNHVTQEAEFDAAYKSILGEDDTLVGVDDLFPVESTRVGVIVDELFQPNNIAPLIPTIPTSQVAIKFLRETVGAQGAAETDEGAAAPDAVIDWAEDMVGVEKVAVSHALTEELAADASFIRAVVNGRLRTFVNNREDLQLLKGDGTSPNIRGVLSTPTIGNVNHSLTGSNSQLKLEAILNAKTTVLKAFQSPQAVVGTATTWELFRLAKDGNLNYLLGPVAQDAEPRIWGMRYVSNENMDEYDTATNVAAVVGDFSGAANIFRRQDIGLTITDSHADEFLKGVLRVRMTTRLALVVWRPSGFCTVTVTA